MAYQHLSYAQRCQLLAFLKIGYLQKEIAKELGVSPSTIAREIMRNQRWNGLYCPDQANSAYKLRRKTSRKPKTFTQQLEKQIKSKLEQDWSPEQISGYGKRHGLYSISHERIYQYILADKQSGGKLYLHLRQGRKKYRKRYGSSPRRHSIKNKIMIDERPTIVEQKERLGDWEIDTLIGKNNKYAIVTLVERITKKTLLGRIGTKHAEYVCDQIIEHFKPSSAYVFTLTSDNGNEFAYHERIAKELAADFYFAHPYSSWERGLNENTNGLIRQYIPKGTDFSTLTEAELVKIEACLNTRPRKSLGYMTPNEMFNQMAAKVV